MPLRPSKHMWQRHSPSGFPTLLILSSSSSCWWRVSRGPWPLQIDITKGPGWSTPTALCPTWFLVSQTPCCHWWEVPHPALHGWDKSRKGVAVPPGCPPHSQEGDPPRHALQRMAQGIHHCPPPIEVVQIQMGNPW